MGTVLVVQPVTDLIMGPPDSFFSITSSLGKAPAVKMELDVSGSLAAEGEISSDIPLRVGELDGDIEVCIVGKLGYTLTVVDTSSD